MKTIANDIAGRNLPAIFGDVDDNFEEATRYDNAMNTELGDLKQGTTRSDTGLEGSSSRRVRSRYIFGSFYFKVKTGYKTRTIAFYDENVTYTGDSSTGEYKTELYVKNKGKFARIIFMNDSDLAISPDENIIDEFVNFLDYGRFSTTDKMNTEGWGLGDLEPSTYSRITYNTTYANSGYIHVSVGDIIVNNESLTYLMVLYKFDENFTPIEAVSFTENYAVTEECLIKIVASKIAGGIITDSELVALGEKAYVQCSSGKSYTEKQNYEQPVPIRNVSSDIIKIIDFPVGASPSAGICAVGNELWQFASSDDGNDLDFADFYRMGLNFDTGTLTLLSTNTHNLGHVNSISYNSVHDSLICGNGGSDYNLAGEIIIVENPTSMNPIIRANSIVIDCSAMGLGSKFNVVWGENNYGENDIAYLITDDGAEIRKIQLGRGLNNLGLGVYNSSAIGFNGTFKILESKRQGYFGYDVCVQGVEFFNNKIVFGYGHNTGGASVRIAEFETTLKITDLLIQKSLNDGSISTAGTKGVTSYDNYLLVSTSLGIIVIEL